MLGNRVDEKGINEKKCFVVSWLKFFMICYCNIFIFLDNFILVIILESVFNCDVFKFFCFEVYLIIILNDVSKFCVDKG